MRLLESAAGWRSRWRRYRVMEGRLMTGWFRFCGFLLGAVLIGQSAAAETAAAASTASGMGEVFKIYFQHTLDMENGVVAFAVLQALVFTYWSQTKDFIGNVKYGGHKVAVGLIVVFTIAYAAALCWLEVNEVRLIESLPAAPLAPLAAETLVHHARVKLGVGIAVAVLFGFIAFLSVCRYFAGRYDKDAAQVGH
jgi:hypothetical protein